MNRYWSIAAAATGLLAVGAIFVAAALVLAGGPKPVDHLHGASEDTRMAYALSKMRGDLYQHLPCYCGCTALALPHRSLLDCFQKPDGSIEPHAVGCKVCVDIALDAERAFGSGTSHGEIRKMIDAKYAQMGPATNTAPPAR